MGFLCSCCFLKKGGNPWSHIFHATIHNSCIIIHPHSQSHMGNTGSRPAEEPLPASDASMMSSCPVPERYRNSAVYNVYNQRINDPTNGSAQSSGLPAAARDAIDPTNNMPVEPNQQPCPGQMRPLSTDRIASTIPKGGTDSTWLYPSPQMFFNGELVDRDYCLGFMYLHSAQLFDTAAYPTHRMHSTYL
jgi:hypothetical protein